MAIEEYISKEDVNIEVYAATDNEPCVYVKFSNFEDAEEAYDYAEFLADTLPLLITGTKRMH